MTRPRHPHDTIEQIVRHACDRLGWIFKTHQSGYIWGTIHCPVDVCYVAVPLSPPDPGDIATSIEVKVHQCEH